MGIAPSSPVLPPATAPAREDPFEGLVTVKSEVTLEGTATIHVQPQSSALSWCVQPDEHSLSDTLICLRSNDTITITSPNGAMIFDGVIQSRFHIPDPLPFHGVVNGQPSPPKGFQIYWSPEGIDPHRWLSWFQGGNKVTVRRHVTGLVPPTLAS